MRLCGIGFERGIVPGARTGRAYGSGRSRQAAVRGVFPRRQDLQEETLVIEAEDRRGYSARYKELTGDFYLKM